MSLPAELKKVLAQVKKGDKLNCTVIFGIHSDKTEISENCPVVIGKGDEPDTFYCSLATLNTLFDPDTSKEDFIIAEFIGPDYSYLCQKNLAFKANGWKLKLRGFMVGGYWDYTLIDPQGRAYEAGNEWSFMDSSGEKVERPVIPGIKDILIDMTDVMTGTFEKAVEKMPDFDEWVQED